MGRPVYSKQPVALGLEKDQARAANWPRLLLGDRLAVIAIAGAKGRVTHYMILPEKAMSTAPFFGPAKRD